MTNKEIEAIALANGFKLKEQYGGTMALRPYVFEFARALLAAAAGVEPDAWTGKGCGVITDTAKARMIEEGKYGGEFAIAARTAERHDIPLCKRPEPACDGSELKA